MKYFTQSIWVLLNPIRHLKYLWDKIFESLHLTCDRKKASFTISVLGNNHYCLYFLFINTLLENSSITAQSFSGEGGNINLSILESLILRRGKGGGFNTARLRDMKDEV